MNFTLTEEQEMIRQAARDFAHAELLPGVIERDETQQFPSEQVKKMGELGFMGMMVAPEYGGSGLDTLSYVLTMEELSKVDASSSVVVSVNNSLVCWGLETFGSEEQKEKYLKKLASGEIIGAFCLSEPEAGSDATSQKTTAIDKGDHYILNGTKNWITNGSSASVYLVIAQTHIEKGYKGINALIVEKGMPGFEIGPKENKLGIRGSDTHSLLFNDVKVPKENRIGEDGFGFKFAMKTLAGGRIGIAAQALGIAAGAYELAKKTIQKNAEHLVRRYPTIRLLPLNWQICIRKFKPPDIWCTKQPGTKIRIMITIFLVQWPSFMPHKLLWKLLWRRCKYLEETDSLKNTMLSV